MYRKSNAAKQVCGVEPGFLVGYAGGYLYCIKKLKNVSCEYDHCMSMFSLGGSGTGETRSVWDQCAKREPGVYKQWLAHTYIYIYIYTYKNYEAIINVILL